MAWYVEGHKQREIAEWLNLRQQQVSEIIAECRRKIAKAGLTPPNRPKGALLDRCVIAMDVEKLLTSKYD